MYFFKNPNDYLSIKNYVQCHIKCNKFLSNTTNETPPDKTNEKKSVHRYDIVPQTPKEEKIQKLVEN